MILSSPPVIFISLASDVADSFQRVVNLLRKYYRKMKETLGSISIFENLSKKCKMYRALRFLYRALFGARSLALIFPWKLGIR